MDNAVIFGAGATGRGLMGQLFTASGYAVTFVDTELREPGERGYYRLAPWIMSGAARCRWPRPLLLPDYDSVAEVLTLARWSHGRGPRGLPDGGLARQSRAPHGAPDRRAPEPVCLREQPT